MMHPHSCFDIINLNFQLFKSILMFMLTLINLPIKVEGAKTLGHPMPRSLKYGFEGVHSLLCFAYTCAEDLFIGGLFILQ